MYLNMLTPAQRLAVLVEAGRKHHEQLVNQLVWNNETNRYEAAVKVNGETMTLVVDGDIFSESIENAQDIEDANMSLQEAEQEMLNPLNWYGAGLLDGAELI